MNLLQLIKQAAVEAVAEGPPCPVYFGTVSGNAPLSVQVDGRFELEEALLARMAAADELEPGDAVLLLRAQDKFVILGRVAL